MTLLFLREHHTDSHYNKFDEYLCECGNTTISFRGNVKNGRVKSCGCGIAKSNKRRAIHQDTVLGKQTSEYMCWRNMRRRCYDITRQDYTHYGGRGISVCEQWKISYENFLRDMGRKPDPDYSLDRIDVNGNYEPGNCRWATPSQQAANKRKGI